MKRFVVLIFLLSISVPGFANEFGEYVEYYSYTYTAANTYIYAVFTATETGTVSSIAGRGAGDGGTRNIKYAVYSSTSGYAENLIAVSEATTWTTSASWAPASISFNITAGVTYALGVISDGDIIVYETNRSGIRYTFTTRANNYTSPISFVGTAGEETQEGLCESIYATYTTGEAPAPLVSDQPTYRFGADDEYEANHTWFANENVDITTGTEKNVNVRFTAISSAAASTPAYQLDYKLSTDSTWTMMRTSQPVTAVPYVLSVGAIGGGTGAFTLALPAATTPQVGDLFMVAAESTGTIAIAGWTHASNSPVIATTDANTNTALNILYYWFNGTYPGLSVADSGNHQIARMWIVRGGLGSGDPFNVTVSSLNTTQIKTMEIPTMTTTVDKSLVFEIGSSSADATSTVNWANGSNNTLGTLTNWINNLNTSGNGGGFSVWSGTMTTAGAVGITTATTVSSSRAGMWAGAVSPATVTPYKMLIATSSYVITGGTQPTTNRLSNPSGSAFQAGEQTDDTNPLPAISMGANYHTELEWCIKAVNGQAADGNIFQLKLHGLTQQSTTPQITIGAGGGAPGPPAAAQVLNENDGYILGD